MRGALEKSWFFQATVQKMTYTCHSGSSAASFCEPAMLDSSLRDLVIAAAIVFMMTALFVDRQILSVALEYLPAFW
jgi:hypothetical protein